MKYTNEFGHYTDSPVDKQLNHSFAVLKIKNEQHRKILNRQPRVIVCKMKLLITTKAITSDLIHTPIFENDWNILSN